MQQPDAGGCNACFTFLALGTPTSSPSRERQTRGLVRYGRGIQVGGDLVMVGLVEPACGHVRGLGGGETFHHRPGAIP